ncbi:hypothetical protein [Polyangium aurulentum]|uniref:hypothetical protein n=1 Tax=Polyangium aurulentum TaxID=2567896 RepID=UPI0010AE6F59|nr:hypothetical protein [Polyangium aurulentum]UQA58402.1 hypothetical protein E8A73_045355 [Polyangium aurulentum]
MTPPRLALALALLAVACGPSAPAGSPAPVPARLFRYDVTAGPGARELSVSAVFPQGRSRRIGVEDGALRFVRDLEIDTGDGEPLPVSPDGNVFVIPACPASGCRLRYRFLLADAARAFDDVGFAEEHAGAMLAPASTWLLRPFGVDPPEARFRLRVTTPAPLRFVSGIFRAPDDPSAFDVSLADLPHSPYSAFGPLDMHHLEIGASRVEVALVPGLGPALAAETLAWIESSARAITSYYGRFPVPRALVIVLPARGDEVGFSSALGHGGASIVTRIGKDSPPGTIASSWVMAHEMVHLGFPNIGRRRAWLAEGLATYVEPIARARAGLIPAEEVWRWLVGGLPQGLPEGDDSGLDHTPTWGRIYWGGALFCLLADLAIRERTGNARSLDDALAGVVAAGGTIAVKWSIEEALEAGDRAAGVTVLGELFARMKDDAVTVDLDALFATLGVRAGSEGIEFDDAAPLAALRAAMTAKPASKEAMVRLAARPDAPIPLKPFPSK